MTGRLSALSSLTRAGPWCVAVSVALLSVFVGACREVAAPPGDATEGSGRDQLPDLGIGGDFELVSHEGRPFRLAEERGKIVLLFFGYTSCPDVCPMTLGTVAQVKRLLGADAARVVPLLVSVDPERDTPDVLERYLGHFQMGAIGLTGTKEAIDAVVEQYRAKYEVELSDSAMGPTITHTALLFLIDQQGRLRHRFRPNESPEVIADTLRPLLHGSGPPTS